MSGRPRKDRPVVAIRRAEAIKLRTQGASWDAIATECGYAGKAAAQKDVSRALEHMVREPAEQLVNEQLTRLDALLSAVMPKALKGQLGAVDRVLRVEERRAKLMGLDRLAETRAEVEVSQGQVVVRFSTDAVGNSAPPVIHDLPPTTQPA